MVHEKASGAAHPRVEALIDGAGPFFEPREVAFPEATRRDWRAADHLDPNARDNSGRWCLQFRCYLIRSATVGAILVDAGIGPADPDATSWLPTPGRLPASLAEAGIDPAAVTILVLTHLHADHIGWAMATEGSSSHPYFPNARYIVQQGEVSHLIERASPLYQTLIQPLQSAGRLAVINGDELLAPGVLLTPTPGHTPGHQSVLVDGENRTTVVAGDVFVHAVQLAAPEVTYKYESNPREAHESRRLILDRAGPTGTLATAHLTEPFVGAARALS